MSIRCRSPSAVRAQPGKLNAAAALPSRCRGFRSGTGISAITPIRPTPGGPGSTDANSIHRDQCKSIGQDASCGARRHDHVVKTLRIRLCFLFNLHRRKRLNPKIKRLIFASWKVKTTPLHTWASFRPLARGLRAAAATAPSEPQEVIRLHGRPDANFVLQWRPQPGSLRALDRHARDRLPFVLATHLPPKNSSGC